MSSDSTMGSFSFNHIVTSNENTGHKSQRAITLIKKEKLLEECVFLENQKLLIFVKNLNKISFIQC